MRFLQFSDWVALSALGISLLTLYFNSYYFSFVFFARLINFSSRVQEQDGKLVKDEFNFSFVLSSAGNRAVFVDKLYIQKGSLNSLASIENSYDVKLLLQPREVTSQIIDVNKVDFEKGCKYTFTFVIYDLSAKRFHVHDIVEVVESDRVYRDFKLNRFCRFRFKINSFSFIQRCNIWRNERATNKALKPEK